MSVWVGRAGVMDYERTVNETVAQPMDEEQRNENERRIMTELHEVTQTTEEFENVMMKRRKERKMKKGHQQEKKVNKSNVEEWNAEKNKPKTKANRVRHKQRALEMGSDHLSVNQSISQSVNQSINQSIITAIWFPFVCPGYMTAEH